MKITLQIIILILALNLSTAQEPASKLVINEVTTTACKAGKPNGSITVNISGGVAPYRMILSNGAKITSSTTELSVKGLPEGKYWLVIEDNSSQSQFRSSVVIKIINPE